MLPLGGSCSKSSDELELYMYSFVLLEKKRVSFASGELGQGSLCTLPGLESLPCG